MQESRVVQTVNAQNPRFHACFPRPAKAAGRFFEKGGKEFFAFCTEGNFSATLTVYQSANIRLWEGTQ